MFLLAELGGRTETTDPIAGAVIGFYNMPFHGRAAEDWLTVLCHVTSSSVRSIEHCQNSSLHTFFLFFPTYMGGEPVGRSLCPFQQLDGVAISNARRGGIFLHARSRTKAQDSAVYVV